MTEKKIALEAAAAASEIVKKNFGRRGEVRWKAGNRRDLVTETDVKSERAILSIIKEAFPRHGFYSEESGGERVDAESVWVIDPLDGTTNFTRGIPCVSISIALVVNGSVQLGVIVNPITDEIFVAERGKGTFANSRRVHVSHTQKISEAFVSAAWWSRSDEFKKRGCCMYNRISEHAEHIRNLSGTTWCLTRIANGSFDVQTCDTQFHDVAAAMLIVEEAGGLLTDYVGVPIVPFGTKVVRIVAANPVLHKETLSLLSQCI